MFITIMTKRFEINDNNFVLMDICNLYANVILPMCKIKKYIIEVYPMIKNVYNYTNLWTKLNYQVKQDGHYKEILVFSYDWSD
jgi:hypothetical protein